MEKIQQLEMYWQLFQSLIKIPNDYRTQNHTALLRETQYNIYEISSSLELDQSQWNTENTDFKKPLILQS